MRDSPSAGDGSKLFTESCSGWHENRMCHRDFWISPKSIGKTHPRHARSQNPSAHPVFSKGAPARLSQAAIFDLEITTGGRGSRAKSGKDFCDLGGAGFFLALNPYSFSVFEGVFCQPSPGWARAGPGLGPGWARAKPGLGPG